MDDVEPVKGANPREVAVQVLRRRRSAGQFTEDLLAQELGHTALSPADRALAQELVYGVVRWEAALDWLIERKTTPGRTQKPVLQILLRLGLYQLFWLDRIPDHAAVHETVKLAQQQGFGPQAGFLNAVLRGYIREREATQRLLGELREEQPALGYSQPTWLFERWEKRWGREKAVSLLRWNNAPPPTFARLNTLRADPQSLQKTWQSEQVQFEPKSYPWAEGDLTYELKQHPPLRELRSFKEGWFYIQDPSTLLAPRLLDCRQGDSILDLCAAPGGKTTFLAQSVANQGQIIAEDIDESRLKLLTENCERLGVTCVQSCLTSNDSAQSSQSFDRILLDAPCSNTGVLRRRVDLRWRIRAEEVERLRRIQLDLLRSAVRRLKAGGTLVYSTCSLDEVENQGVIAEFLAAQSDCRLEEERELLPFQDQVDGAYVARIRRLE